MTLSKVIGPLLVCALFSACGGGNTISDPNAASSSSSSGTGSSSSSVAPTVLRMGSGTGSSFQDGQITLGVTSLSAGGSTSVSVNIIDQNGLPYTQSATVSFTSPCVSNNRATFTPSGSNTTSNTVTTTTGTATVTYSAQGCSGDDVITAATATNSQALTATGTITVASAVLGSVQFVSASPSTIGLKGTGVQETSKLIFKAVDSSGGAVAGATVSFALTTTVGGMSLSNASGTTGLDGTVQTIVQAGTVHTSVRVTATATLGGVNQSTQSSNLSVTTGVPVTSAFSVAPVCPNIEAWSVDGVNSKVTVRLADRYNNPVPDGTAIVLSAEGGKIDGECATTTTANESGVCTVNWTSQLPRPSDGRVSILATALGEDSFTDSNANGFFDTGEAYQDLGEPYRDDNENDTYDIGEQFLDFTGNQSRDATYGSFKGITCTGVTPGSTCSLNTVSIGGKALIIMSSSDATIVPDSANVYSKPAGGALSLLFNIHDANNNAMPSGTKVDFTASSNAGTIEGTSSFTVPCTSAVGGTPYGINLTLPSSPKSGFITIKVTSPQGLITQATVTVTAT